MHQKRFLKGFTIASKTIPYFVNLNSKLIELKKSASRWTRTRRKISPIEMTEDEYLRYKKNWWISLKKSGKIGPMRNRSDFNEALTKLHRLHQESGEEQLAQIPYWQYQQWHPSVFFIQHILVAVERFLLELMTINKKVRN